MLFGSITNILGFVLIEGTKLYKSQLICRRGAKVLTGYIEYAIILPTYLSETRWIGTRDSLRST